MATPFAGWPGTLRKLILRLMPKGDRKSTRLNSSHSQISYAVFCLKKKIIVLQLPDLVTDLKTATLFQLIRYELILSIVTSVIRIVWLFALSYHQRIFNRKTTSNDENYETLNWKNVLILAWTVTRGVVSRATTLDLPLTLNNGDEFPKRHSILLLSFFFLIIRLPPKSPLFPYPTLFR